MRFSNPRQHAEQFTCCQTQTGGLEYNDVPPISRSDDSILLSVAGIYPITPGPCAVLILNQCPGPAGARG
jgi:hypothetical protein